MMLPLCEYGTARRTGAGKVFFFEKKLERDCLKLTQEERSGVLPLDPARQGQTHFVNRNGLARKRGFDIG